VGTGPGNLGSSAVSTQVVLCLSRVSNPVEGSAYFLTFRNDLRRDADFCRAREFLSVGWNSATLLLTFILVYSFMSSLNKVFPKAGKNKIN
jgi:hypothetical protein